MVNVIIETFVNPALCIRQLIAGINYPSLRAWPPARRPSSPSRVTCSSSRLGSAICDTTPRWSAAWQHTLVTPVIMLCLTKPRLFQYTYFDYILQQNWICIDIAVRKYQRKKKKNRFYINNLQLFRFFLFSPIFASYQCGEKNIDIKIRKKKGGTRRGEKEKKKGFIKILQHFIVREKKNKELYIMYIFSFLSNWIVKFQR